VSKSLGIAALALLVLTGCAPRHAVQGQTYAAGTECHTSVVMLGCDDSSPPHCRAIRAKFDKGCERLLAGK